MKKFAFALDKVLEFKRQYEDSIRNEHAAIMHEIRLQEERFAELSAKDKDEERAGGRLPDSQDTHI